MSIDSAHPSPAGVCVPSSLKIANPVRGPFNAPFAEKQSQVPIAVKELGHVPPLGLKVCCNGSFIS